MGDAPTAYKIQTRIGRQLADRTYDVFRDGAGRHQEIAIIKSKIAFALFGPPTEAPDDVAPPTPDESDDPLRGYSKKQIEILKPIYDRIESFKRFSPREDSICLTVLFICVVPEQNGASSTDLLAYKNVASNEIRTFPLFKVRKCISKDNSTPSCCIYVDDHCREYDTWRNFLYTNKLPEGILIAPKDGVYQSSSREDFYPELEAVLSPESRTSTKIKKYVNYVGMGLGLGSMALLGATFLPIAAPVAAVAATTGVATGAASGAIGLVSSTGTIVDRATHNQTIGFSDAEARNCWFNIVGSSLGVVSGGMGQYLRVVAAEGQVLHMGIQHTFTATFVATAIANGAALGNNVYSMLTEFIVNDRVPSTLEVLQLTTSLVFFAHSTINFKTANAIIQEHQNAVINQQRAELRSNRHRKMFDKMVAETKRINGDTHVGNAQVIRSMNHIENKDVFFAGAVKVNKELNLNKIRISFGDDGKALLNANTSMEPSHLRSMPPAQRSAVLESVGPSQTNARNVSTTVPSGPSANFSIGVKSAVLLAKVCAGDMKFEDFIVNHMGDFVDEVFQKVYSIAETLIRELSPALHEMLLTFNPCGLSGTIRFVYDQLKRNCAGGNFADEVNSYFHHREIIRSVFNRLRQTFEQWIDRNSVTNHVRISCEICGGTRYSKD